MKKAFTLIELLVVIAIIAILAAILFPVFAQAKTAAKKTVAVSGQKQIALGFMMYMSNWDDQLPRRRGCEVNTSLNPKFNDGNLYCGGASFADSMTYQTWQKYIMPYVKNVDIFFHPLRQKDAVQWDTNGQILNSYVINLSLFGASTASFESIPWSGGNQNGVPNVSATMMTLEMGFNYAAPYAVPNSSGTTQNGVTTQTVYPLAVREYWRSVLLTSTGGNNCTTTDVPDPVGSGPHAGMVVGFLDGHAAFYSTNKVLGATPTAAQYGVPFPGPFSANCRKQTSAYNYAGSAIPNLNIDYPFWGLSAQ